VVKTDAMDLLMIMDTNTGMNMDMNTDMGMAITRKVSG
jgi:hypothetical protein